MFSHEYLVCLLCVGVDLVRQNSITQQILTQYLQKRLNRAGGSVQVGQPQLLAGSDNLSAVPGGNGVQKNSAENLYARGEDDDIVGDAQYYQGTNKTLRMPAVIYYSRFSRSISPKIPWLENKISNIIRSSDIIITSGALNR